MTEEPWIRVLERTWHSQDPSSHPRSEPKRSEFRWGEVWIKQDTKSIRSGLDLNLSLPAGEEEPQHRVLHEKLGDDYTESLLCRHGDRQHNPTLWLSVAHEAPRCGG